MLLYHIGATIYDSKHVETMERLIIFYIQLFSVLGILFTMIWIMRAPLLLLSMVFLKCSPLDLDHFCAIYI